MVEEWNVLKKVSLFKGIDSDEISKIVNCIDGKVKKYSNNQIIIRQGEEITSLGIVLTGNVQVVREDIMGNRMLVTGLEEGDIFGETFACAGVKDSPVSVITNKSCNILWISLKRIVTTCPGACDYHVQIITNLLSLLAKKNLYLNNKMELLSKRSIREKIMFYLTMQMEETGKDSFDIQLNRNELADYLCIDRSAMCRELSKLRDEHIIDYQKNHFELLK